MIYNIHMMDKKQIITAPTNCPCCDYALIKINAQLFCKNIACPAQLNGKLIHFCKVLGIKGMGPKTLEKLQLQELTEIFYLDHAEVAELLGEKTATKLLEEIEGAKKAKLNVVLESFSIPLVGTVAAKKICTIVQNISEITKETCKLAGLGDKVTQNLLYWLETDYKELKDFLPFTFEVGTVQTGKTVCITGKLKSFNKKADAESVLTAAGFVLVDSVTKATTYLIDEGNANSSKREKAEKYGITIITDLNDLLKDRNK